MQCIVVGCDRDHVARRLCRKHYQVYKRGFRSLDTAGEEIRVRYSIHEPCSYYAAHTRVTVLWGSASQYLCIRCGRQARDWSYDGTDPEQLLGQLAGREYTFCHYSIYPEFYVPMCRSCHRNQDELLRAQELAEYREWKFRTGEKDLSKAVVLGG